MSEAEKDRAIKDTYHGESGFGSIFQTYKDAKAKVPSITHSYVKNWFSKNIDRTKAEGRGQNSYVAQRPYQEYQIDIFFITDKQMQHQEFRYGLSCIDIFSKYACVVPIKSRDHEDIMNGMLKAFEYMGKQPDSVMTDPESSLFKKEVAVEFEKMGVHHIITQSKPQFAERFHRTFRGLFHKMLEYDRKKLERRIKGKTNPNIQWQTYIPRILNKYNNQMVSSATGMTPNDARKEPNQSSVKASMELRAMRGRKYPTINVGDIVRVHRKKILGDKEFVGNFRRGEHEVLSISENFGQKFYRLDDRREYIRSDITLWKKNV